jgi:hypothetical protein
MTRYTDYPNIVELKNKIADTVVNDNEYKLWWLNSGQYIF